MPILLPLILALLAGPLAGLAGMRRPAWAAPVGVVVAALAAGATLWRRAAGGGSIDVPWAPSWDLHLAFSLDGLAGLYVLLATGIGVAVLVYSSRYIAIHLEHGHRPPGEAARFYFFLLAFMGAMAGTAMAQDLVLIFVFWDLTTITSYYLIGYDRDKEEARAAALMAFLVTGVTSVLFLIGALLLYIDYGTFSVPDLIGRAQAGPRVTVAMALIAIAALAKSAQVPLHFWLPRAMAAPAPVSAYLHSAAMVAAGILLLQRIYPLLALSRSLLDALLAIGLVSMYVGGLLALTADVLKRVLAYSTVAQYGYMVAMIGIGGEAGMAGVSFYVLAHALIKSTLFLLTGAIIESVGEDRLSRVGGLARRLPWLAAAGGIAAAGLGGVPLTIGFFKDELFYKAALERGGPFPALAALGAAITIAYIWRFWSQIFLGKPEGEAEHTPAAMVVPPVALALLVLAGGLWVRPFARLAGDAGTAALATAVHIEPAYHLAATPENLLALLAYAAGVAIVVSRPFWVPAARWIALAGARLGPERWYDATFHATVRVSARIYQTEARSLAHNIAGVLLPTAALLLAGMWAGREVLSYRVGSIGWDELPLALALALSILSTLTVALTRSHLSQVLALSSVSACLAAAFAFFGAPDVALVAVLLNTVSALLLFAVLGLFPKAVLAQISRLGSSLGRSPRDFVVAAIAGIFALGTVWATLSQPAFSASAASRHAELTEAAHAKDVVTAILADFRGIDTLGEITVIVVALLGIETLMGRRGNR